MIKLTQNIQTATNPAIAIKQNDGVLLAVDCNLRGASRESSTIQRVAKLDEFTIMSGGGDYSDWQTVTEELTRVQAELAMANCGYSYSPVELGQRLRTINRKKRYDLDPYLCDNMILGLHGGKSQITGVDPMGLKFPDRNQFATGAGLQIALPFLEDNQKENMPRDEAVNLLQKVLLLLWKKFSVMGKNYIIAGVDNSMGSFLSDIKTIEQDYSTYENFVTNLPRQIISFK